LLDGLHGEVSPDSAISANRRRKSHAIQTIIYRHANAASDLDNFPHETAEQRYSQKSMCDCRLEWRVAPDAVAIQMNPLAVARNVRKLLNQILRDREPIGSPDFPADPFG